MSPYNNGLEEHPTHPEKRYIASIIAAPLREGGTESEKNTEKCGYLNATDLSDAMIAATLDVYSDAAPVYAGEVEWSEKGIRTVVKKIVSLNRDFIQSLKASDSGEKPRVLVAGAGTLMMAVLFRLMNDNIEIDAYDAVEEMLIEGYQHITMDYIIALSTIAGEVDPSLNGYINIFNNLTREIDTRFEQIGNIIKTASNLSTHTKNSFENIKRELKGFFEDFLRESWGSPDEITESIKSRIHYFVADHISFKNSEDTRDTYYAYIDATGTYPHLKKFPENPISVSPLDEAIAIALSKLDQDGEYHFNVKVDENPALVPVDYKGQEPFVKIGRVFYDQDLGPGKYRYFSTLSSTEVESLKHRIEHCLLFCSQELKEKLQSTKFEVKVGPLSEHATNPSKPPYADFFVRRIR